MLTLTGTEVMQNNALTEAEIDENIRIENNLNVALLKWLLHRSSLHENSQFFADSQQSFSIFLIHRNFLNQTSPTLSEFLHHLPLKSCLSIFTISLRSTPEGLRTYGDKCER